ncbi:hypothetical protein V491_01978 [Pseudogymnoascus sp. VKM F-3775]|nr:hypothetical protein V491_01978 [Pseudogymnoascus sp. VKM F-3775]
MKFSKLFLGAQLSAISSALQFTNANFANITVRTPFNITWADASGATTLTLVRAGTYAYSKDVLEIASNISTSYFVWTPTATTIRDIYSIRFNDSEGNSILGFQFELLAPASEATPPVVAVAASTPTSAYATVWTYP